MSGATDEIVLESIDRVLRLLGEGANEIVWGHVERADSIKNGSTLSKIEAVHKTLTELFGPTGRIIEGLIAKNICIGLGINYSWNDGWSLIDYYDYVKKHVW